MGIFKKLLICYRNMHVNVTSRLILKEETDRTGSILKAGHHLGPDCGL